MVKRKICLIVENCKSTKKRRRRMKTKRRIERMKLRKMM